MTSALVSFTFNNTNQNTITIRGKHWTRAVEVCKGISKERGRWHQGTCKSPFDLPNTSQPEQ